MGSGRRMGVGGVKDVWVDPGKGWRFVNLTGVTWRSPIGQPPKQCPSRILRPQQPGERFAGLRVMLSSNALRITMGKAPLACNYAKPLSKHARLFG